MSYVAHGAMPDGQLYLAMDLLRGHDLAEHLARGPLSVADALRVVRRAGEALAFAHARSIVHRDIKPTRSMVGRSGRAP